MKILLSWLHDYLDIPFPPEKIAEALNMAGIEVEGIHHLGRDIKGVVTGKILAKNPHPNADKLTLCTVDVGASESLSIVCGATNMKEGDIVPVARLGATLPGGIEIRRAKIRGVESFGMMCSRKELGLADDHSGLYILPPETPLGQDLVKLLRLEDVVFEISITPNRGDALSHLGIARELSALFNLPLHRAALDGAQGDGDIGKVASVVLEAPKMCPRYGARVVEGLTVGPSPRWLQERLEKIGLRPINNVVDVTNYVMMDIGHPLHAFDLDKLEGQKIVVRTAKAGEKIRALDNNEKKLEPGMLVIADATRPVAIAGVMGGEETGVTAQTKRILLEAAWFDPVVVRKTAKQLGMMSDSSYRFERGTNIDNIPIALNLAVRHIVEVAGGKALKGMIDVYPDPRHVRQVMVRPRRVSQILGFEFKPTQIETLLNRLKFEVRREEDTIIVGVPPFRHDIEMEADLIEEIARLYGYDNLPTTLPGVSVAPPKTSPLHWLQDRLLDHLVGVGFHQLITYSFIPGSVPHELQEGLPFALRNPISEENGVMRTSLVWGMYDAIRRNILADEYDLRFFEIGRAFQRNGDTPTEPERLCIGVCGKANSHDWRRSGEAFDLYQVKGIIEGIGRICGQRFEFRNGNRSPFHPTNQLEIRCGSSFVGVMGQLHPMFLDNKKMPSSIFIAELDLGILAGLPTPAPKMKPIPEFPPLRRDLALVLPIAAKFEEIRAALAAEGGALLEECTLFDVYQGKGIEPGKRSLAFALTFRSPEKTLTDELVQPKIDAMVARIEKEFQGKLRG